MFEFFAKSRKLLGMNARNLGYVRSFNRKRGMRIADHKLLCKRILAKNNLPVSTLIAKIHTTEELETFDWNALPNSFVLKPNRGFGGEGILVVYGKKRSDPARNASHSDAGGAWVKADGSIVTIDDIKTHIRNILDGSFSLSNTPDSAFFEERLKLLKLFKPYAFKGIPDIRVIVFNKIPIMAMLRLPTRASDGKANLQQGAIGLGIDMATGTTTTAIQGKGSIIEYAPGTRLPLSGIKIPYWKKILTMSVQAQEISGLGFLGADIAIDRDLGPVILELNARPGLSIQLANLSGLKERLDRVKGLKIKTVEKGIRVGMDLFGGEIEEELEEISGRRVIGCIEKVKLIGKDGKEIEVEAKIDTGADSTSIDTELAKKLGFSDVLEFFETIPEPKTDNQDDIRKMSDAYDIRYKNAHPDLRAIVFARSANGLSMRPKVEVSLIIDTVEISARTTIIDRSRLEYPVIIGRKNLSKFLVDVNK
ncbi:MAG: sugar-transfer associated ATP-grasp domain-containing protein [Candidatus Moraniibacteriota bacterium]